MATTQLSVTATPGKPHTFSPKTADAGAGPHTGGPFTALQVTALPGQIHSFNAKTAAAGSTPRGSDLFTAMSVLALPGIRLTFNPKTAALIVEEVPTPTTPSVGGAPSGAYVAKDYRTIKDILREDKELMDIVAIIVESGMLDN